MQKREILDFITDREHELLKEITKGNIQHVMYEGKPLNFTNHTVSYRTESEPTIDTKTYDYMYMVDDILYLEKIEVEKDMIYVFTKKVNWDRLTLLIIDKKRVVDKESK